MEYDKLDYISSASEILINTMRKISSREDITIENVKNILLSGDSRILFLVSSYKPDSNNIISLESWLKCWKENSNINDWEVNYEKEIEKAFYENYKK